MKFTFRDIIWVAILALVIIWLSKCHRDEKTQLGDNATKALKENDSAHSRSIAILNVALTNAEGRALQATEALKASDEKLSISLNAIKRLSAAVKASKAFPVDTSFVTVSPEYVNYCDSLALVSEKSEAGFENFKNDLSGVIVGKDSIINVLKQTVSAERNFSAECKKEFTALESYYKNEVKGCRPRNQLYAGVELLGNKQLFIQNIGAVISLKTKQNKLWQISSGLQSNGLIYGRVSGSILISFKK